MTKFTSFGASEDELDYLKDLLITQQNLSQVATEMELLLNDSMSFSEWLWEFLHENLSDSSQSNHNTATMNTDDDLLTEMASEDIDVTQSNADVQPTESEPAELEHSTTATGKPSAKKIASAIVFDKSKLDSPSSAKKRTRLATQSSSERQGRSRRDVSGADFDDELDDDQSGKALAQHLKKRRVSSANKRTSSSSSSSRIIRVSTTGGRRGRTVIKRKNRRGDDNDDFLDDESDDDELTTNTRSNLDKRVKKRAKQDSTISKLQQNPEKAALRAKKFGSLPQQEETTATTTTTKTSSSSSSSSSSRDDDRYEDQQDEDEDDEQESQPRFTGSPSKGVTPCNFGASCFRPNCTFAHPIEPCRFALSCTKGKDCKFNHNPPCRYGAKCTRPMCTFTHYKASPAKAAYTKSFFNPKKNIPSIPASKTTWQKGVNLTDDPSAVSAETTPLDPEKRPNLSGSLDDKLPCRYGIACTNAQCKYRHPEGRTAFQRKPLPLSRSGEIHKWVKKQEDE
eukprot:TRINITY_DN3409_c2_g1_i2.p1 TRINITY_DN3409_c2_g1~~TRINITY_DN3409_c2_g1_i2.p1  ORF type:complete len:539 (+),score=162.92 TRINITY_DN3409_c2_g1_i2:90-1619(+)